MVIRGCDYDSGCAYNYHPQEGSYFVFTPHLKIIYSVDSFLYISAALCPSRCFHVPYAVISTIRGDTAHI